MAGPTSTWPPTRRPRSCIATIGTARSPTSPSKAAPPTARTAARRRAWVWRSATTTATACSICSRRTSPTTSRRSIAISARGCSRTSAVAAGLAVENRFVEWGAGLPDFDNDGLQDLFYVTGNVYPEIERMLRSIRIAARASSSGTRDGDARFVNVTDQSGDASAPHSSRGAAVWRHRQRRRRRRPRS